MSIIKSLRERLKLSQKQLGEAVGVGQTAISNYEVGERTPEIDVAIKLRDLASENHIEIPIESILVPQGRNAAA